MTEAFDDFRELPGTHLRWVRKGHDRRLLTNAGELLATSRLRFTGVISSKRVVAGNKTYEERFSTAVPVREVIEVDRLFTDGFYEKVLRGNQRWKLRPKSDGLIEPLPDDVTLSCSDWSEVGDQSTLLRLIGTHVDQQAYTHMRLSDGSWLRFPVEGLNPMRAVMSADTPSDDTLVRYRFEPRSTNAAGMLVNVRHPLFDGFRTRNTIQIVVSPEVPLNHEMCLVVTLGAHLLIEFFRSSG